MKYNLKNNIAILAFVLCLATAAYAAAPVIATRTPDVDEITINLVDGAAIIFSVTATDGDNDTLEYTWTLGGVVISGQAGSALDAAAFVGALQPDSDYLLQVSVTDGQDTVSNQWILHVILEYPTPWPFTIDPDSQYTYPIYGTAAMDGVPLSEGDWIGVFDTDGNCYGLTRHTGGQNYSMSVYAASQMPVQEGFGPGEKLSFRFFIGGEEFHAISVQNINGQNEVSPQNFPEFSPTDLIYDGNPQRIDLVTADEETFTLRDGQWHFISFNVQPESTKIEEAFSSILNGLKYVSSHDGYWWKDAPQGGGGSLTDVDAYHSYQLFIDLPDGVETCELKIKGIKLALPKTFDLTEGWNNISYLYDETYLTIHTKPEHGIGIFDVNSFSDNILWIRGPEGRWTMPNPPVGTLEMNPGDGFYIKMGTAASYTYDETPLE